MAHASPFRALAAAAALLMPWVGVGSTAARAGAAPANGATTGSKQRRNPTDEIAARAPRLARFFARGTRTTASRTVGARATSGPGSLWLTDPTGDVSEPRADITALSATVTTSNLRLAVTVAQGTNPGTDPIWNDGGADVSWGIDTSGDGTADFAAIAFAPGDGTFLGGVVDPNGHLACFANATWDRVATYAVQLPPSCVHLGATVSVGGAIEYGTGPTPPNDSAPGGVALAGPVTRRSASATMAGAFTLDAFGGLHAVNIGAPQTVPTLIGAPYWRGFDIARGVAMTPDGGHGYVVDGYGGLHGFGVNGDSALNAPPGAPYWKGWDIARSVATMPDGSGGYVLDGWGGLHPFSFGPAVPPAIGASYWPGWQITRGVATMPDGSGGFVLDAWGGLHWFSIGTAQPAPAVFDSPYWRGWDIARGITILPDGTGGYVIDAWGGLHWFSVGVQHSAPVVSGVPYWPGQAIARGFSALPGLAALPVGPIAPAGSKFVALTGALQNVVVDSGGTRAYVTDSASNQVHVVDLASGTKVASIPVGSAPVGLDLTPDGSKLYVANSRANNISVVDIVSLAEVRRIAVPQRPSSNDRPISIAIGKNGIALYTTTFDGSGYGGRVMQLDLTTESSMQRTDARFGGVATPQTIAVASRDRSTLVLLVGGDSGGGLQRYDATTNTFAAPGSLSTSITTVALDGAGSRALVDGEYDVDPATMTVRGTILGWSFGEALNGSGSVGYRTAGSSDSVDVLDMPRDLVSGGIGLPDSIPRFGSGSTSGVGHMTLTPDDARLVVITDHGLSVIPTS